MSIINNIANTKTEELKSNMVLTGKTKKVRITLSALTRLEYIEEIEVPVEMDDRLINVIVESSYDKVDGGEYYSDEHYLEKSECKHELL